MSLIIKELRMMTGMTQKEFAGRYGIPVSTLRKWEQGEASPPRYVVDLIAGTIPATDRTLREIKGRDGNVFYYDEHGKQVSDSKGNVIHISEDIEGVKEQNLRLYLTDLFNSFYEIQEKFRRDCYYDKKEDILWI